MLAANRFSDWTALRSMVLRGIVVDVVVVVAVRKSVAANWAVDPRPIFIEIDDGTPAAAVNVISTM